MTKSNRNRKRPNYDHTVCCFQGGGALGAYQVGVLQALQENDYIPNWFVGTSIGAINSAIAAGNAVDERIDKMRLFWKSIATPAILDDTTLPNDIFSRRLYHFLSAQSAMMFGQPGFYKPRIPMLASLGWPQDSALLSYYDTAPLRNTLERFVDFDRINAGETRLSVGAVEVSTGRIDYFDSTKQRIGPEHIMASGALPPGFPAIEIEGRYYWDGGISSNTPLSYVLRSEHANAHTLLCFMVHLFDSYGLDPCTLDDVEKRRKDIEYSSRFDKIMEMHQEIHALKYTIHQLSKHIPQAAKKSDRVAKHLDRGWDKTISLVRFLYQGDLDDLSSKDYEFSRKSIIEHIDQG